MDNIELEPTAKKVYEKIIQSRKIKQLERNENLIWAASKNGRYSVKNGYRALINTQSWDEVEIPQELCWDLSCLPKVGFFLWMTF